MVDLANQLEKEKDEGKSGRIAERLARLDAVVFLTDKREEFPTYLRPKIKEIQTYYLGEVVKIPLTSEAQNQIHRVDDLYTKLYDV